MKKTLILLLACLTSASLLAACTGNNGKNSLPSPSAGQNVGSESALQPVSSGEKPVVPDGIRTLADAFAFEEYSSGIDEERYVYVFENEGVYWRATADMSAEISEKVWDLDLDETFADKAKEIVSGLPVSRLENLTEMIPAQQELDKYVGKTGQDLIADGFECSGYNLETMEFSLEKGPFAFTAVLEGTLEDPDNFDWEESIIPLSVRSLTYAGLGNSTEI
ncbi:MAG: hypothetical protein J5563_01875 [Clostridia bacterium]|nr:hypothetical protein [Clostridia bacterium]